MNAYLNYVIEANLGLLLFTIIYFIMFEKETQFTFKRWYLLVTIAASLVFPLIEFTTTQTIIPSISSVIHVTLLPEVVVHTGRAATTSTIINYWNVALGIYGMIASVLLLSFLIRMGKLLSYLKSNAFTQQGKFRIIESPVNHPAFSFFHYIFIGNAHDLSQAEKEQIINHEKLHASRIHSLDLLVSEVLKIIFWFNPVVYILKNQLISIHEFEADQQAVQHQDADQYCELLARGSLASAGFSLANHFHNSLTLKRIVMINSKKTKMKNWKYLMLIPVLAGGLVVVSCQDQIKSEINEAVKSRATAIDIPAEVSAKVKELQKANPNREYIVAEVTEEGIKSLDALNNYADKSKSKIISLSRLESDKNPEGVIRQFIVIEKGTKADVEKTQESQQIQKNAIQSAMNKLAAAEHGPIDKGKIYEAVQQAPTFRGGLAAMAKYLQNELHYPPQARSKGVEGKVFIQFIVDENGKVSDAALVKGIGAGCDEEALRVVAGSPDWNPGKQDGQAVKVRYIIPINFTLD